MSSINNAPPNGAVPTSFTLHVTNIPIDLEKDGVASIFSEFGLVTGALVVKGRNNTNQAYISYSKYSEAERAINELNNKEPLILGVQFKDKNIEKKSQEINLTNTVNDYRYRDSHLDNVQFTKKAIDMGKANCTPIFQPDTYTTENELLYPVPEDMLTFNPYESPSPYHDTNLMYTRGITHISKDGRRHISCGRGYTYYHLPEPNYNIGAYIQNVCERREKGIYEYVTQDTEDDTGNCKVCSVPTSLKCQNCCIAFYCSRACQVSDWLKHKSECHQIPPLIKKIPVKQLTKNNGYDVMDTKESIPTPQPTKSEVSSPPKQTTLRRPKFQPDRQSQPQQEQQYKPTSTTVQPKINSTGIKDSPNSVKSNTSPQSKNKDLKTQVGVGNFKAFSTSFSTKKPTSSEGNDVAKNCEDNIAFEWNSFIPKDKYVAILITSTLDNGECWVQRVDDMEAIEKLSVDLEKYAKTATFVDPEENIKCIVEHESVWYRAIIISLKDDISKVFHIDFGTIEYMPVKKVCPMNGFQDLPSYARKIRFTDEIDLNLKEVRDMQMLSVKALKVLADGTIVVDVQPMPDKTKEKSEDGIAKQLSSCKITDSKSIEEPVKVMEKEIAYTKIVSFPNVLDILKVDQFGIIMLHADLSCTECNITLVPHSMMEDFTSLLEEMKTNCEALLAENPKFSPKVGDLVCGQSVDGEWFRGIVISIKPVIKMAVIDESRVFIPINSVPIPEKYYKIFSMGLVCKFLPGTEKPKTKFQIAQFTVTEVCVEKESAIITINCADPQYTGKVSLRKWVPKSEQKGVQWSKLTSGQDVVIIHCSSHNLIYVRSLETEEKERTHRVEQEVAKYALNRKPLTEIPVVGQMVLSLYEMDKNYYRAIVIKIENEKVIIKYVDYGNEETTKLENLFFLPDELKEHAAGVAKIKLKGVNENLPLTEDAKHYIDTFMSENVALNCTFVGHPFEDGVILKTSNNENVNDKLNLLLKPSWKQEKPKEDRKVYTLTDLPPLKIGDVGDEVEAIALAYYPENGLLILGPNDVVAVEAIQEQMTETIAKYVEATTSHYIPRDKELCIAKYTDMFYRALCLDSSASPTESRVFFVDYGNTERVKHTDIRAFAEDFVTIGAFATLCSVTTMIPENKFDMKVSQRVKELVPVNDIIKVKIISVDDDETLSIDIPSIRVKLTEEGLI